MEKDIDVYHFFAEYVRKETGIIYTENEYYRLDSRLYELKKHYNCENIREVLELHKKGITPQMHEKIINLFTNNETFFMRDLKPFMALGKEVVPEIEKRLVGGPLEIWSGASSTGQEPYSIIMSIDSFSTFPISRVNLTATDISEKALNKAKDAFYDVIEVQRGLPAPMLVKYFSKEDDYWKVKDDIRNRVNYSTFNLLLDNYSINRYHIIFLRNVLIYQNTENKEKILKNIYDSLRPEGYLFLGGGESLIGVKHDFHQEVIGQASIYRKK